MEPPVISGMLLMIVTYWYTYVYDKANIYKSYIPTYLLNLSQLLYDIM